MPARTHSFILLGYIVALLLVRHLAASAEIYHFQPYIALFFCLAATGRSKWLWVPAVGYMLSTMFAVGGVATWMVGPLAAFTLIILFGSLFSRIKNSVALLAGSIGGGLLFHLLTNSLAWLTSGRYLLNWNGLAQSLWTGLPSDPIPTWVFLRNDLVSTVLFSAIFLLLVRIPHSKAKESALVSVR